MERAKISGLNPLVSAASFRVMLIPVVVGVGLGLNPLVSAASFRDPMGGRSMAGPMGGSQSASKRGVIPSWQSSISVVLSPGVSLNPLVSAASFRAL